jgi:hypothetical protein
MTLAKPFSNFEGALSGAGEKSGAILRVEA